MRPQPLIAVTDVEASSRWYQRLLGCRSDHGGKNYERLVTAQGTLVLQLHAFEVAHDHGPIGDPDDRPYGNGVLLWFEVDDFGAAAERAAALRAEVVLPRHRNPPDGKGGPNHWELWLRDPDGYTVVLASPDGTVGRGDAPDPRASGRPDAPDVRTAGRARPDASDVRTAGRQRPVRIVACTHAAHAEPILAILNEAIATSTALYDYKPRSLESMRGWFSVKESGRFPVLGAVDEQGALLGFASYGTFRAWPAYKYTVEHSVYVHRDHRGRGLGRLLMQHLIAAARERDVHVLVAGIDVANAASIALHEQLGFTWSGTIRQSGFKFGRWLDLGFYQLILETPASPVDG